MNRPSRNRRLLTLGGMAATLFAAGIGCTSSQALVRSGSNDAIGIARAADGGESSLIRAQSPDRRTAETSQSNHRTQLVSHHGVPVENGMVADGTVISSYPPGSYIEGGYVEGGYPPGYCPPEYCPPGYHGYGPMVNCPRYPGGIHYTHTYEDPGVPVYPPGTGPALTGPGSPGAVVQYPYYTTKGPDCFFLDEDGRY